MDYKIHNEPTKNGQRDRESAGSGEQTHPSRLSGAVSHGGPITEDGKGRALPRQGLGQGSRGRNVLIGSLAATAAPHPPTSPLDAIHDSPAGTGTSVEPQKWVTRGRPHQGASFPGLQGPSCQAVQYGHAKRCVLPLPACCGHLE